MIRLRVLGTLDVRDDKARDLGAITAQPKRLAVLAYLAAAAPSGLHRRDRVLALFWPELDEAHARDALNSSVRFLRRGLGDSVIVTRGPDHIGIDPERCWCDAAAMREAIAAGRYGEALSLYRGDLLAGFFVDDSPVFDEWLERERTALRIEAASAAHALSEEAAGNRDGAASVSYARRAFELAGDDERALRHLLQLLDHVGDRVGAIQTYESYARRVSADYDATPAPETQFLIERIRSRSTAHEPAPRRAAVAAPTAESDDSAARHDARTVKRRPTRALIAGCLVVAAAGLAGLGAWLRPRPAVALDPNAIAVFPFRVTGSDSSLNYLREGTIDLANVEFSGDDVPRPVDSRTILALVQYELADRRSEVDHETAIRLASRVGAGQVLLGELVSSGGGVTGTARVLRTGDGHVLAQHAETGPNDLEVVRRLLRRVLALAGGESRDRLRTVSDSTQAVRAYLAGMTAFRDGRYEASVGQFRKAVGIDSAFALGWLWLSTASQYTGADHLYARIRAWSLREALTQRDRAYLAAVHEVNPRTSRQKVEAFALAAAENPDRAEIWRMWSIAVGIEGAAAGVDGWLGRATAAADSAIALDSSLVPAIAFRIELALRANDQRYLARTGRALLATLPAGPGREFLRWAIARKQGDSSTAASVRAALPRLASSTDWTAVEVAGSSVVFGLPLDDAELIATMARQAAITRGARVKALDRLREIAAIRGRMSAADAYSDSVDALGATSWYDHVSAIMLGLTEPGFERVAERAARSLEVMADSTRSRAVQATAICHAQLWRISRHDTVGTRAAIGRLRQAEQAIDPKENWWWVDNLGVCSMLLETAMEVVKGVVKGAAFGRLEAAMRDGLSRPPVAIGLLLVSRWYESAGDHAAALAALRRRIRVSNAYYFLLEPRYLREEGRLAALVGDTAGAARAYRHFLAIRDRPDAGPVHDEVRWVRARLSELGQ